MDILKNKKLLYIIAILIAMTSFFISCGSKDKGLLNYKYDPETMPSMRTDSIDMYISSDSGYVKYRVITQIWEMYDNAREPFWYFPEHVKAYQFDSMFHVVSTVDADSIYYYQKKKLWKLMGNVVIKNTEGTTYTSDEFFWDENTSRVYSNVLVKIEKDGEGTLYGRNGFWANQDMSYYEFYNIDDSPIFIDEQKTQINNNENKEKIE